MKIVLCAALMCIAATGQAATLGAESLLCESSELVALVKRLPEMKGLTASAAVKSAESSVQMAVLMKQAADIVQTRKMRDTSDRSAVDAEQYKAIAQGCASSGVAPLPAEVLQRKPVSGVAKVRVLFKGNPADLFTAIESIAE